VLPSFNLDLAIASLSIANWHIDNLVVEAGCTKEQVEITKGVKIAEV